MPGSKRSPSTLVAAIGLLGLLGACSAGPNREERGYYSDPNSVAPAIAAEVYLIDYRDYPRVLDQSLISEAIAPEAQRPLHAPAVQSQRAMRKRIRNADMRALLAALDEYDWAQYAQPTPHPGADQVFMRTIDGKTSYITVLPVDLNEDSMPARIRLRQIFWNAFNIAVNLEASEGVDSNVFFEERRRLEKLTEKPRSQLKGKS